MQSNKMSGKAKLPNVKKIIKKKKIINFPQNKTCEKSSGDTLCQKKKKKQNPQIQAK